MNREHMLTATELEALFPDGIPLSVAMIAARRELSPAARNEIIKEIVEERNPSEAACNAAASTAARMAARTARREALTEVLKMLDEKFPWGTSKKGIIEILKAKIAVAKRKPPAREQQS